MITLDNPDLADLLTGRRVAAGPAGSGTAQLARHLLTEWGIADGITDPGPDANEDALAALDRGDCDAGFFVLAPDAPKVADLLADPELVLVGLAQARGLAQRTAYLSPVTLARGVIDPARDLPSADLPTVAPTAYLAVRADTHRAVVQLLVRAAVEDQHPQLVGAPNMFPTLERADLPVAEEARYFYERGPNVLYRTFPFWIASTIDRMTILLIPMLTVLIPLFRIAPPTLRWRIRRRIYRWYRQLRVIDDDLGRKDLPAERLAADRDQLRELDDEVSETDVPLSYMEEFYNLRLHIAYMRRRVDERLAKLNERRLTAGRRLLHRQLIHPRPAARPGHQRDVVRPRLQLNLDRERFPVAVPRTGVGKRQRLDALAVDHQIRRALALGIFLGVAKRQGVAPGISVVLLVPSQRGALPRQVHEALAPKLLAPAGHQGSAGQRGVFGLHRPCAPAQHHRVGRQPVQALICRRNALPLPNAFCRPAPRSP